MIYAYEGEGSDAGSLSSVDSYVHENENDFDFLQDWGPKFSKLSKIYQSTDDQLNHYHHHLNHHQNNFK
jgi:cadherin 18 type 2